MSKSLLIGAQEWWLYQSQGGNVWLCVDLTRLNESVCRERHPLLAVEQTLAQLAKASIFTKLDANSGFWQIPLANESGLLTTFFYSIWKSTSQVSLQRLLLHLEGFVSIASKLASPLLPNASKDACQKLCKGLKEQYVLWMIF